MRMTKPQGRRQQFIIIPVLTGGGAVDAELVDARQEATGQTPHEGAAKAWSRLHLLHQD